MNQITLVGNLTKDPELRFTPNGNPVAEFDIAVTKTKNDKGEWISDFFKCVAWGKLAENISESFMKGSRAIILGKLSVEKWEHEGTKRQAYKIRVESIGPELTYATCVITKNIKPQETSEEAAPQD